MSGWLSSTWEPNWRSFQYFNLYRLVVAAVLVSMSTFTHGWLSPFRLNHPVLFDSVGIPYILIAGGGAILSVRWHRHFNLQLSFQVIADAVAVSLLMFAAGGLSSGLGVLLLVTLAAASLVGRGHMVLFYAAVATLSVLVMEIYGVLKGDLEAASIIQAGFLSAGFFATAVLARLLGQRMMVQEELARRRGIALENQTRISQRIIERMQGGVLIVGRDGTILRCNPVVEAMLGISAQEAHSLESHSPALAKAFEEWLRNKGVDAVDFTAGRDRELRARFESSDSSDGEVLVFLEDVGRIKERAQQLKLASLGRLTGSIAHEIRNPLAAISHATDLLREELRGEMQGRLLRILGDNVSRLDRIVQDVLELGRSDRATLEYLRLDLFVRDFAAEFLAAESPAPAVLRVEANEPAEMCFDRSHLHQILWNLTGNALRHCRGQEGSVRLVVTAARAGGRVELHVIDDGPGVPEAIRGQVFEPFFTTHHKGTGLGLFIARELCEANGASLELGPTVGCGHFIVVGRNDKCRTQDRNVESAVS
ncbi:MAG: sensor histidine kinase [Actinomycetota bacterium]